MARRIPVSASHRNLKAWPIKKPIYAAYLVAFLFRFIDNWQLPLRFTAGNVAFVIFVLTNLNFTGLTAPVIAILPSLCLIFFVAIAAIVNLIRRHTFTAVANGGVIALNLVLILGSLYQATMQ